MALDMHRGRGLKHAVRQNRRALKEWGTRVRLAIEAPTRHNDLDWVESWGGHIILGWFDDAQQGDLGRAWDELDIERYF